MLPKIIYVQRNGKVPKSVSLSPRSIVTWRPFPARGHEVGIRFVQSVPFSDWGNSVEMSGPSVSGTVKYHVGRRSYHYKAFFRAARKLSTLANPKLIVDGGGGPNRKPKARKRTGMRKTRAAKK